VERLVLRRSNSDADRAFLFYYLLKQYIPMKNLLLAFTLLFALGLNAQGFSTKKIKVKPYLSVQNYEHFKRMVINADDTSIEFIDGFDFEWGYTYELKISVKKLKQTWSDGTRYEHKLIKVISKTKVPEGTTFKMHIDPMRYYYQSEDEAMNKTIVSINDSTYSYFDKIEIEVPQDLKPAFDTIVNGENGRNAFFTFTTEGRIRLLKF
jgi:hypothetical protein